MNTVFENVKEREDDFSEEQFQNLVDTYEKNLKNVKVSIENCEPISNSLL